MANISKFTSEYYQESKDEAKKAMVKAYAEQVLLDIFDFENEDNADIYLFGNNTFRVKSTGSPVKESNKVFIDLSSEDILTWDKDVKDSIDDYSGKAIFNSKGYLINLPKFSINRDASTFMDTTLHSGEFEVTLTVEPIFSTETKLRELKSKLKNVEKDTVANDAGLTSLINKFSGIVDDITALQDKSITKKELNNIYKQVKDLTPEEVEKKLKRAQKLSKAYVDKSKSNKDVAKLKTKEPKKDGDK